jgi:hypothetical protein
VAATVTIRDRSNGDTLTARLTGDIARVTDGYGGWEEVDRPKRKGFPDWQSAPLLRMEVPLMFDGLATDSSVQPQVDRLEKMAQVRGERQRPPTVALSGPVPHTGTVWVIENPGWGDSSRRPDGALVRQEFTLQLLQWQDSDLVKTRPVKRRNRGMARTFAIVLTRHGRAETLMELCARALDDASKWREVAKLNKITRPRHLKVGQKIRLS